jgi:hypothetical protein
MIAPLGLEEGKDFEHIEKDHGHDRDGRAGG